MNGRQAGRFPVRFSTAEPRVWGADGLVIHVNTRIERESMLLQDFQ